MVNTRYAVRSWLCMLRLAAAPCSPPSVLLLPSWSLKLRKDLKNSGNTS